MKLPIFTLVLASLTMHAAHAQTDVFLCVDDRGNKEYKNTGATKGCKRIEMQGMTIVAAPRRPVVAQTASVKQSASNSPGDFPKIDNGTQKARDSDRKQILLDELKTEETKLDALKKDFNGGEPERQGNERNYAKYQERVSSMKDEIGRTEKNIEALKREIGNQR